MQKAKNGSEHSIKRLSLIHIFVIDPQAKTADVILPAGASTEVDNEIPGMNKGRIMRALQKDVYKRQPVRISTMTVCGFSSRWEN